MDLCVENSLVIETKTVREVHDIPLVQLVSYLEQGDFRLGLVINFNTAHLKNGIRRVVHGLDEYQNITASSSVRTNEPRNT